MHVDDLLARLDGVRPRGTDEWSSKCPAHADKSPSLSVRKVADRILVHCFALCEPRDIVAAMGIRMVDLFSDAPTTRGQRSIPKPSKLDRVALAFRFELTALDRRLRAERIIAVGKTLDVSSLSDAKLDRALGSVAQTYADVEQAELFEGIADDLRIKEILGRSHESRQRLA